jgi:RNA polymerase sigma-70 factor, ECF subfamily
MFGLPEQFSNAPNKGGVWPTHDRSQTDVPKQYAPNNGLAGVADDQVDIQAITEAAPQTFSGDLLLVSEEELVAQAQQGSTTAFGELIRRHHRTCLKRAMLMVRNRSDAEDEVQNACWKAFHRLEQFRGDGTFAAWLSRIVENQCLMRIREERNSRFVYLDECTESNVRIELVGQSTSPEDQLGWEEVVVVLRREIVRMPPLFRNIMMLHDIEQLPISDVATRLGLSVPAAKSRLMRARRELRCRVLKHCGRKGAATLTQKARYSQAAYTRGT